MPGGRTCRYHCFYCRNHIYVKDAVLRRPRHVLALVAEQWDEMPILTCSKCRAQERYMPPA